jgi:rSAM/selenodomain-associated transferase 2
MADLAVVVAVLLDYDALAALLADIPATGEVELIVVDGGSDSRLPLLLDSRVNARLLHTEPGRARQLNAGAAVARADVLLFLHADSRLPAGWIPALRNLPDRAVGGWFRFALDDDAWQARFIERAVAWRVRLFRLPYGDQGLFVRRSTFARLGGFADWPLMEDVEFVRRLVAAGPVEELALPLRTSSRRWRRDGWFTRSARNLALLSLYFAGVSPRRLARWYAGVPPSGGARR